MEGKICAANALAVKAVICVEGSFKEYHSASNDPQAKARSKHKRYKLLCLEGVQGREHGPVSSSSPEAVGLQTFSTIRI